MAAKKGEHQKILDDAKSMGYVRARIDGEMLSLEEKISLDRKRKHTIEIVVDSLPSPLTSAGASAESVEGALETSAERIIALVKDSGRAGNAVFAEKLLSHLRDQRPRAPAAPVLLQQSLRRLPECSGSA